MGSLCSMYGLKIVMSRVIVTYDVVSIIGIYPNVANGQFSREGNPS